MKKEIIDNIIFLSFEKDLRAGGPGGYLANLELGLNCVEGISDKIRFITADIDLNQNNIYISLAKLLTIFIPVKKLRKFLRKKIENFLVSIFLPKELQLFYPEYYKFILELDKYDFKTITSHFVKDTCFLKAYINSRKLNTIILSMSHSPEPPSQEFYAKEIAVKNPNAKDVLAYWENVEKDAFNMTDIFIFPSKESIIPYSTKLNYFNDLLLEKKCLFIPTGCKSLTCYKSIEDLKRQFNVNTKYVISYIGRHNLIKGYDRLIDIAKIILEKRNDVTFLIGGKLSNDIAPLEHSNWIELGIVNPAEVLKISDAFILPNRQTYFDLILLEVMSMGIPVFASETGGNISVYNQTKSIDLFQSEAECADKIIKYLNLNSDYKIKLMNSIVKEYKNNYTTEIFGKNYISLINNIILGLGDSCKPKNLPL